MNSIGRNDKRYNIYAYYYLRDIPCVGTRKQAWSLGTADGYK